MIKTRLLLLVSCLIPSTSLLAMPCFYTLAKSNCWTDYALTVKIIDVSNNNLIATAVIPKGKSWVRVPFTCQAAQGLNYTATFEPTIWQGQENTVYNAQHYWYLPEKAKPGTTAWNIPVCFPDAFAEVPFPPQAGGNCKCDFSSIPAIPPQKT